MRNGRDAIERSKSMLSFLGGALNKGKQMLGGGIREGSANKKFQDILPNPSDYKTISTPAGDIFTHKDPSAEIIYQTFTEAPIPPETQVVKDKSTQKKDSISKKGRDYVPKGKGFEVSTLLDSLPQRSRTSNCDDLLKDGNPFAESKKADDGKLSANDHSTDNTGIRSGPEISDHQVFSAGGTAINATAQTGAATNMRVNPGLSKIKDDAEAVRSVPTEKVEAPAIAKADDETVEAVAVRNVPIEKVETSVIDKDADEIVEDTPVPAAPKPDAEKKEEPVSKGSESIWKKMVIPKLRTIFLPASCGILMLSPPTSNFVAPKENAHTGRVIKLGPAAVMQATQNVIIIDPVKVPDPPIKDPGLNTVKLTSKNGEKAVVPEDSDEIIVPKDLKEKDLSKGKGEEKATKPSKPQKPVHINGTKPVLPEKIPTDPLKTEKTDATKAIKKHDDGAVIYQTIETIKLTPPKRRRCKANTAPPKSIIELEKERIKSMTETINTAKTDDVEKPKESLNKIMADSKKNEEVSKKQAEVPEIKQTLPEEDAKSVPAVSVAKLPPIIIDDEVADIMRIVVPDLDPADIVEEDDCWAFSDGIEESIFAIPKKESSGVVFSFGGTEGEGCVRFSFGCM
ncbi:MAG: hypothetical protein IKP20_02370 [Candidatus Methanomethylophilaceae archaeon]|nr:hypothetical protein [Candidatus Methanomethylophilaceae archaeon]